MKINWKARFRNKTFLVSALALTVSFVYHVLSLLHVVAPIEENEVMELITALVNILGFIGVVIDPTTEGLCDSERAMTYCTDCDVRKAEENGNE